MTHSNHASWDTLAHTVDDLQSEVSQKKINTIPALLQALAETKQLPGITQQELSVVYRDYGQSRCEWVVHEGRVITDSDSVSLAADSQVILDVLNGDAPQSYSITNGAEACRQVGFDGYQSVLIVPMKLDDQKRLGAFIILNKEQSEAYDLATGRILDVLSDRVALLARMIQQRQREEESTKLRRLLSRESNCFTREAEILTITIKQLKTWYQHDKIYILIKNPLNTSSYYQANSDGDVIPDFRLADTISSGDLFSIVGGQTNLDWMTRADFEYPGNFIQLPSPDFTGVATDAKSWIGATIYHDEGVVLGHIILHNTEASYAYGDEDVRLLSKTCALVGSQISKLRFKQKDQLIVDFESEKVERNLYENAFAYLNVAYGIKSLLVYAVNTATQDWGVKFQNGIFTEPDPVFRELVIDVAQKYRISPKNDERKGQYVEYYEDSGNKYLVVPMRIKDEDGDFRVVGCFVIPAQNQGLIATRIIDEVSDALAKRKKELDDDERQKKLNEYIKKVSKLSPEKLTVEESLELAENAIAEIMFSANLYFALYDQEKNEISFPVIYKDGMPWEGIKNRSINPEKQGRTEAIILTGKPILIKTLADSKAWYNPELNRQEFAGNPLASWVGVPIFNDKGVRGVIAVYHPDLDYVYSSKDVGFLENVAGAISTLFRMVEINQAKQKITEMTAMVIEKEKYLTETLLIRDFSHHLNNQLGAFSINTKAIRKDIDNTIKTGSASKLDRTIDILDDLDVTVESLLKQSDFSKKQEPEDVDLHILFNELFNQAKTTLKLFNVNAIIEIHDSATFINVNYQILYNCLQVLIENAGESFKGFDTKEQPYIKICSESKSNMITVDIIDNGKPIPLNIKKQLFEYGVSSKEKNGGYGLWRARMLASSLGGNLEYIDDFDESIKHFQLSIPCRDKLRLPVAVIIDDEQSWRNIVSRWLEERDIETKVSSNYEDAVKLLSDMKGKPVDLIFLDVSLDRKKGSDVSGLSLIQIIKDVHPKSKIILLTGYSKTATAYIDDIDFIIDKVKDGKGLTEEAFWSHVKGFVSNVSST